MANGNALKLQERKVASFLEDSGLTESEQKTIMQTKSLFVKAIYMADRFRRDILTLTQLAHTENPKLRLTTYLCFGCTQKYAVDKDKPTVCPHCGHNNAA